MSIKLIILLALFWWAQAGCPSNCSCYLDQKGRNAVVCKDGGIVGPLDLTGIKLDTEVLKITAPEDNMNSLTMGPLRDYKKLEELHITRSNIPQLGELFFWGLTKLDVLNLSQNNITQPLDHNFRGLSKLKELYLDDNRILSLPSGTFRYLHELKLLSIQRNRMRELESSIFLEIGKLKVLKLSGNNLKELNPEVFKHVQELRSLECRGCALSHINKNIYQLLPHLTHLDLGANELKTINSDDLTSLNNLKNLKLDANQITTIRDATFTHVPTLKKLNLAHNEIVKISANAFVDLHNLTELDLSYNKLEGLEDALLEPVRNTLQVLILSGNHLKLHRLKGLLDLELNELRLVECGIVDIHTQIFPDSLSVLDLGGNHLSSIPSDVFPLNLIDLDISRNRFRGLDEGTLLRLENIQSLKLEKNPWSCDLCHIVPLLSRVNRSSSIREIKCAFPYTVQGKKLGVIQRNELTWCSASSYTASDANFFLIGEDGKVGIVAAGMSVFLLCLTIVAIVAALLYNRRHAARYYTHEDKLAVEGESIFDNHSPLFCDGELSFKFPLDHHAGGGDKKISIATIDEIKKEHAITNGT